MTATCAAPVYDELVDVLSDSASAERIIGFQLSDDRQGRLDDLLEKNRAETLTPEEEAELADFVQFEHIARLLKARALQKRQS